MEGSLYVAIILTRTCVRVIENVFLIYFLVYLILTADVYIRFT